MPYKSTEDQRQSYKRYARSAKGRATQRKYNQSPKGKALRLAVNRTYTRWRSWALGVLKINMGGCVDCGYSFHPAALDFDHKPEFEKRSGVGVMVKRSWGDILEEIAKCDLVCANCHRIRTVNRRKLK